MSPPASVSATRRGSDVIAVFYDRKHNCEVTSEELVPIKLVAHYARCEDADDAWRPSPEHLRKVAETIGELGYTSPDCPAYQNWDRAVMLADLVFLYLRPAKAKAER